MKKLYKVLLSALVAISLTFSVVSCNLIFEGGSGSNASGIVPATKNVTIDIKTSSVEPEATDLVTLIKRIRSSVVEIYVPVSTSTSSGSGVVIGVDDEGKSALIITCHHVIEGGDRKITVKTINGFTFSNVELVGSDPVSDIGVLRVVDDAVATEFPNPAVFPKSGELAVGTSVLAIGNPLGYLGGTVTQGIVSAVDRNVNVEGRSMNLIQTDAAINSGNSGGGLFNAATGELVGIVNAGYKPSTAQGLSFAISSTTVKDKFEKLVETANKTNSYGYIEGYFDFGVEFSYGVEAVGLERKYCIVVSSLDPYGLFYKNGIFTGDVIKSVTVRDKNKNNPVTYKIGALNASNVANEISALEAWLKTNVQMEDEVTVSFVRYGSQTEQEKLISFSVKQYVYGKKD